MWKPFVFWVQAEVKTEPEEFEDEEFKEDKVTAKVTAAVSFISMIKSLETFSDTSLV